MNERLGLPDLVELLAAKHGMSKREAEGFAKEFFLLIEQALESDRCVKIKGFGTFKLVDVDSRESVKVNTGERFEIQGHTKISFVPDTVLRNTINKPFEHFETVILNENTVLEDTLVEEQEEESDETVELIDSFEVEKPVAVEEPAVVVEESAIAVKEPVDVVEESAIAVEEPAVIAATEEPLIEEISVIADESPNEADVVAYAAEETAIPEVPETKEVEQSPVESLPVEDVVPQLSAEDIIAAELKRADKEFESAVIEPEKTEVYSNQLPPDQSISDKQPKEKSEVPYLIAIIVLVLLLCGSALLFVYYPDLFSSATPKEIVQTPIPQPVIKQEILPDTLVAAKDTVAEVVRQSKEVVQEEVRKESPDQVTITVKSAGKAAIPVKPDSVNYRISGTKTTYTIKEGETLTRVSLRFYGTKDLWPYIVQYNRSVIKNPNNVPYGTTLRIPELVKK